MGERITASGQVNVEFLGGTVLFFLALVAVVTTAFTALPEYVEQSRVNTMELNGHSVSTALLQEGQYVTANGSGSDWHNYPNNVTAIGLTTNGRLDMDKVRALNTTSYKTVKQIFGITEDFWITIEEVVPVDTYTTVSYFRWNSTFDFQPHDAFTDRKFMHYGRFKNSTVFLIRNGSEDYDTVYLHRPDGYDGPYDLRSEQSLTFNNTTYAAGVDVGWGEDGSTLLLRHSLLEYGRAQPALAENSIAYSVYENTHDGIAKITLFIWRR